MATVQMQVTVFLDVETDDIEESKRFIQDHAEVAVAELFEPMQFHNIKVVGAEAATEGEIKALFARVL